MTSAPVMADLLSVSAQLPAPQSDVVPPGSIDMGLDGSSGPAAGTGPGAANGTGANIFGQGTPSFTDALDAAANQQAPTPDNDQDSAAAANPSSATGGAEGAGGAGAADGNAGGGGPTTTVPVRSTVPPKTRSQVGASGSGGRAGRAVGRGRHPDARQGAADPLLAPQNGQPDLTTTLAGAVRLNGERGRRGCDEGFTRRDAHRNRNRRRSRSRGRIRRGRRSCRRSRSRRGNIRRSRRRDAVAATCRPTRRRRVTGGRRPTHVCRVTGWPDRSRSFRTERAAGPRANAGRAGEGRRTGCGHGCGRDPDPDPEHRDSDGRGDSEGSGDHGRCRRDHCRARR